MIKFDVLNRWSGKVQFTAEIDCNADASLPVKRGLAVLWAGRTGADLTGANLTDADLSRANLTLAELAGADLSGADLSGAHLTGAHLTGANLSGAILTDANLSRADLTDANLTGAHLTDVPTIPDIHRAVYAAASAPGAFDMSNWHAASGTAHCRAGWVVTLAGKAGRALEFRLASAAAAAALIYAASDPTLTATPDFLDSNEAALADMQRLADLEAASSGAAS